MVNEASIVHKTPMSVHSVYNEGNCSANLGNLRMMSWDDVDINYMWRDIAHDTPIWPLYAGLTLANRQRRRPDPFRAGTVFIRQNLTSVDVSF